MPVRVCLQPCLGSVTPEATVGRQATYAALAELGKQADLGCPPALFGGVPEDIFYVQLDYVLAIESCDRRCASYLVRQKGFEVHGMIHVAEILPQAGFDPAALPLENIELEHPAAQVVKAEIVRKAQEFLAADAAEGY